MESHEGPQTMAGILPEELGQPTHDVNDDQTIDHDVELALGNVRTPNAPVSSRLRSTGATRSLLGPKH